MENIKSLSPAFRSLNQTQLARAVCLVIVDDHFDHAARACIDTYSKLYNIIQICSGITRGREFNGELYAQRLQKLTLKVLNF